MKKKKKTKAVKKADTVGRTNLTRVCLEVLCQLKKVP